MKSSRAELERRTLRRKQPVRNCRSFSLFEHRLSIEPETVPTFRPDRLGERDCTGGDPSQLELANVESLERLHADRGKDVLPTVNPIVPF